MQWKAKWVQQVPNGIKQNSVHQAHYKRSDNMQNRVTNVIFHSAATEAADGAIFEVDDNKTLTIEIYGTSASRTVAFMGRGTAGADRALMGVNLSSLSTAISTTGTGEIWQFDVTGLTSVLMKLTAVAGGNVSVKGRAVA
jgi:hypothetical protein